MTYISDMKKLIFIDACMRAGSRTRRIATPIIAELGKRYSVETVDLTSPTGGTKKVAHATGLP